MAKHSNYDKHPCVPVSNSRSECWVGWPEILQRIRECSGPSRCVLCVECYPGVFESSVRTALEKGLRPEAVIYVGDLLKPPRGVDHMLQPILGDDPVFGSMNDITLGDFFDPGKLNQARAKAVNWPGGLLLILGVGAALVSPAPDVLVYADMARWEIQGRQRRNQIANFGTDNLTESSNLKYKRAFFVDWRAADRLKKEILAKVDFLLDTNSAVPKLVSGMAVREGLKRTATRPFRVVPYFDPGPWGGHWMEEVCDLPNDAPNHAWCFDCVTEENSLLLGFGDTRVELPAIDLTFLQPRELLGDFIHSRFGAEFPIRFDFLDTMGGGNLSLQVHPRTEYIRRQFGMRSTQAERCCLLEADTEWVRKSLINRVEFVGSGQGWREERTGLHELEFIETRRRWFTDITRHHTEATVNVLNLVEGREATVESPTGDFDPFAVHYAETFIVPAAVGAYTIRPSGESEGSNCATIKASVRTK